MPVFPDILAASGVCDGARRRLGRPIVGQRRPHRASGQIGPIAFAIIATGIKMSSESGPERVPINIPRPA